MSPLRIAHSPCPNDTFVFHALTHGLVAGAPPMDVTLADVDVTNTTAHAYDVVKVSYAALPWLLDDFALLPCGGAVGRGCGPLVLTADERPPEALAGASIAVPGDRTTAYLLFRLWSRGFTPGRIVVLPFGEIMPAVARGEFDAGLVIHEARFTYHRHGLHALADLGTWWETDTGLPIPLGAILARRDLPGRAGVGLDALAGWVRASVEAAWADPSASRAYVLDHAQELEPDVIDAHIALYVNAFTRDLGAEGHSAAATLLSRAAATGLVPAVTPSALATA
ncbi:MAG TPA: 1,4-dihydroxy-6-naphthoate synthase [Cryptosporangiaceae bacterium]|nr:1,4-dihydroxy-6-naphthoate synthase [Cryptosporangiaceae bacterium]